MIANQKKRILCLIDSLASGGAQRQMVGLASLLRGKGYVVKVVTYFNIPFYYQQLQENRVDFEYVPCGEGLLERLRKIGRVIKRFNPGVVISYLDTPNILACLLHLTNNNQLKLIVSERNTTQVLSRRERIKFALYRFADHIVPNSYSQGDFIAKYYPHLLRKCFVVTNFVDTEVFSPVTTNLNNDILRVVGVGRVLKQKNIPMLIEAIKIVLEKDRKVRVDWYGSRFENYEECVNLIKEYQLEDSFEFHDACNDIATKYRMSDLFVLPSIYEGFPNVLCEAMSCGLPVIATDVCDNGHIVRDGENGYLVSSGDADGLAERIIRFLDLSPEQRREMAVKSRRIAMDLFSTETFINSYIKMID